MNIQPLTLQNGAHLYALWLRGISDHPVAFGSTVEEFQQTSAAAFTEQNLSRPERFVVLGAFVQQELVGFVALARDGRLKLRHTVTLGPVYVSKEMQGQGIGGALVEAALTYLRSLGGVVCLKLSVAVGNSAARRLYRRCGFVAYGIEPNGMYIDGEYIDMELLAFPMV